MPARGGAPVASGGATESNVVVPGAAFEHTAAVVEMAARPLEHVSHGVEQAVRTRASRILADGCCHSRTLRSAVQTPRIPGVAPGKGTTVRSTRGLLPLRLARQATIRLAPPTIRLRVSRTHEHYRMVILGSGWTPVSPKVGNNLALVVVHQEALAQIFSARDARRPVLRARHELGVLALPDQP